MKPKVIEFPVQAGNIAQMLRALADDIEARAYGEPITSVVGLDTSEGVYAFIFGRIDTYAAIGLFDMARHELIHATLHPKED